MTEVQTAATEFEASAGEAETDSLPDDEESEDETEDGEVATPGVTGPPADDAVGNNPPQRRPAGFRGKIQEKELKAPATSVGMVRYR